MKTSSCKAKGRNLQKEVVMKFRQRYGFDLKRNFENKGLNVEEIDSSPSENCYEGDITARPMGCSGTDIVMSPEAEGIIPFSIECKAQENLNIWSAMEQAESNTKEGRVPLLVFKRNRTETYCALKFSDLLKLLK